jgi:hypothetical protein
VECDPVGIADIADRLGVPRGTVKIWHHRGKLPPSRWVVSGRPCWDWPRDVAAWAKTVQP